jgi:capsular exopolysaccharide synthesis family protein
MPPGQGPGQLGPIQTQAHPLFHAPQHGGSQLGPADAWRVIRSNLWLILITLAVFSATGYAVNRWVLKPYYSWYESTGLIRVSTDQQVKQNFMSLQSTDPYMEAIRLEATTQAQMLRNENLLVEVLTDGNSKIRQTKWWAEFGGNVTDAKEELIDHLTVAPLADSRLISVSMEYYVPDDCRVIVNEIVGQHLRKERERKNADFLRQVGPTKERLREIQFNLEGIQRRIKDKAFTLGENVAGFSSTRQNELSRLYDERIKLTRELSEAKNKLANLLSLNNTGNDPPGLDERLTIHPTFNSYRQTVDKLDADMSASDLAPGHFRYLKMQNNRNTFAEKLDDVREEVKQGLFASLGAEHQADIDSATKMLSDINVQIEKASGDVSRSEADRRELAAMEEEKDMLSTQWEKVSEDLSRLQAVTGAADVSTVEWARLPQKPDIPSFPKLEITMTVAILLGLALSLGIAFIRELTDNTVRTPQDIARVGNMNLLGMIPHEDDDPQAAGARLPLVIFDAPQSMLAESFRQVRSRLQHAAALETTRSMLITSAGAQDGKTTVAVNLAAGLALNGRRILLVDANFRRPQLHNVFDTGNETGFGDVLNSLETFEQYVQPTAVPNLSVLTSGAKPLNPTELLESQLLIDFIDRALEEYDHVIFDTGPLPLVSETIALAPRVDGVITVVRARSNSRGLLQRVRDTLRQVKAEHVGVVLNAVRAQAGGYYGRSIVDYYKYQNGGMNGHANGVHSNPAGLVHGSANGNGRH